MRILAGIVLLGLVAVACAVDRSDEASLATVPADDDAAGEIATADHRPVFSADGEQIVFMRQGPSTDGDWELFLASADGSNARRLTTHPGWDGYAAISPSGESITFDRNEGEGTRKTPVLMDLADGATRPLGDFAGWLSVNAWSPDGGLLYAFWDRDGQRDLYALTPDGEIVERITDTPEISEHDLQISRDGSFLVFATERLDGGGTGLDRLDLASGERSTLVKSPGRVYGVALSPDGTTLAFTDDTPGGDADAEIYLLDLATGERRQMTDNEDWDHMPVFHPSGGYLLFTSYRSGSERIYRMELEGGAVSPLAIEG